MKISLILSILLTVIFTRNIFCQERKVFPLYCQFSISDEIKQSNTTFIDGFIFKISGNNKPFNIQRAVGGTIDLKEAQTCLANWKFAGFKENKPIYVYFYWKHGLGWTNVRISTKGFLQTYTVNKSKYIKSE